MLRSRCRLRPMNESCEPPVDPPAAEAIRAILHSAKTVAVVGLSANPQRDSYHVAEYLQQQGYRVIPVNPKLTQVLGEKAYGSLREIPVPVDVVDIFRRPDAVPELVAEAIAVGAKVVWMQDGIEHGPAADEARRAGLTVVMNRCLLRDHRRLIG